MLHLNQTDFSSLEREQSQLLPLFSTKNISLLIAISTLSTLPLWTIARPTIAQTVAPNLGSDELKVQPAVSSGKVGAGFRPVYLSRQESNPSVLLAQTPLRYSRNIPSACSCSDLNLAQTPPTSNPGTVTSPPPPLSGSELDRYLIKEPPSLVNIVRRGRDRDTPGSSITSPIGFGADYGTLFASFSSQNRSRFSSNFDTSLSAGVGLGDARKAVGLEVALGSFSPFRRGPLAVGSISVKAHRLVSNDTSVALGVENIVNWGGTDGGTSVYGVVSKYFPLKKSIDEPFSSITASVGLGGGRFRSESDINQGRGSINPFAAVGVRVARPVSVIMDWSGQTLGMGLSIAPIRDQPFTINTSIVDLTSGAGDGARLTVGVGYGINF